MRLKHIQLSDSLDQIARIGVVFFKHLSNGMVAPELRQRIETLAAELRQTIGSRPLSELESVRQTRKLYHAVGVDPTKDRPSSERLLRRVMLNRPLPKVSKLVDAMNLASLSLQCPLGVYDWDRIAPPVLVRIGRPDESYLTVMNDTFCLEGRLVLVDGEGLFGNPSHDSARTQVSLGTVRALVLAWASPEVPKSFLESVLKDVISLGKDFCDAGVEEWGILG
jgi:DNA/RNA-binding domain of Phe-tRNA-synthetase-like protein